jgi:hypothetical protein
VSTHQHTGSDCNGEEGSQHGLFSVSNRYVATDSFSAATGTCRLQKVALEISVECNSLPDQRD